MTRARHHGRRAGRDPARHRRFALYGFPESHAASFALIAYASAYLKAHHPAAFLAGLLNAWPMGFYAPATLVKDAQRHGVEVRPIDVARSDWKCTLEPARRGRRPARRAARPALRERPARAGGARARGRARAPALRDLADLVRARRAAPRRARGAGRARRARRDRPARAHAARGALAGGRARARFALAVRGPRARRRRVAARRDDAARGHARRLPPQRGDDRPARDGASARGARRARRARAPRRCASARTARACARRAT